MDTALTELGVLLDGLAKALTDRRAAESLPKSGPVIDRDASVLCIFAVMFFVINWGIRLMIVNPFARYVVGIQGAAAIKYAQSVMEALFYGTFAYIGFVVVPGQPWSWPSSHWWIGFADGGHEVMRSDLRCYYIAYMARYIQAAVSILLEPKRKDFMEMMIHHVVTVLVIYVSYVYGWNRIGVVVMALLDPADVPLHLAKLCKYTADNKGSKFWQVMADRLFEFFAVVFFITRLVMYSYACWSAHIEASRYFPKGLPEWTCVVLLYILLILQAYWFSLLVKVAIRMFNGEGVEDIRSDDETEMDTPSDSGSADAKEKSKKDK